MRASIQSVLAQSRKPDRFVVIDNASTDESRQIAGEMGVEVVDADNRYKFITGLNTALGLNSDLLFFMQNDVTLAPDCLSEMLRHSPRYTNFIAQPVIYQTDDEIDNAGMDIVWPGYGIRRNRRWWNGEYSFLECGLVTTICFLTNNRTTLYDEAFSPAYYEDLDMKLRTPHYKHVIVPGASATHLGNHTFSQTLKKPEISKLCRKNRKIFIRKHYKGVGGALRLAVTTCLDIVKETFDVIARWRSAHYNGQQVTIGNLS